jgi:hypothetical protein
MNVYVCVGTDYKGRSQVLYAGGDSKDAWVMGKNFLKLHPSGEFMVEIWKDGGLVCGSGESGPTHKEANV